MVNPKEVSDERESSDRNILEKGLWDLKLNSQSCQETMSSYLYLKHNFIRYGTHLATFILQLLRDSLT